VSYFTNGTVSANVFVYVTTMTVTVIVFASGKSSV